MSFLRELLLPPYTTHLQPLIFFPALASEFNFIVRHVIISSYFTQIHGKNGIIKKCWRLYYSYELKTVDWRFIQVKDQNKGAYSSFTLRTESWTKSNKLYSLAPDSFRRHSWIFDSPHLYCNMMRRASSIGWCSSSADPSFAEMLKIKNYHEHSLDI